MNYKFYALILTCTLAATPAIQAMKATRSFLATARALRTPALQGIKPGLARTPFTQDDRERFEEQSYETPNSLFIPGAVAAGVLLNTQNDMEEVEYSETVRKLNITDINAVLDIFKNGTETDKRIAAQMVGQKITTYRVKDIIRMLQAAQGRSHRILVMALTKNLTYFTGEQINQILQADTQDETHDLIGYSLKQNYNKFTGYTIADFRLITAHDGIYNYAHAISSLQEKYLNNALQPLVSDLYTNYTYFLAGVLNIAGNFNQETESIIATAIVQVITKDSNKLPIYFISNSFPIGSSFQKSLMESITSALFPRGNKLSTKNVLHILAICNAKSKATLAAIIQSKLKKVNEFIEENKINSQSASHLRNNFFEAWECISTIAKNPAYMTACQQALTHEQSISDKSAVFYHSQRGPGYWLELLYTKLWEQKYNQKSENYLFTRFPDDQTEFSNAILHLDGQQKRVQLLSKGRQNELRPYLLFSNYALFGNSTNLTSCSTHYLVNNFNIDDPDITTQDILSKFGNQALYQKYKTEFAQLEKEFKAIVPSSVLLQLAIPHNTLKDHVYLADGLGYKKKLIINGEEIDNVSTIINTLKAAPETMNNTDMQEFCFAMTPDTVHTLREQGAEVRAYGDFDQEKLNAVINKLEALIARIAKENPKTFSARMTPSQSYQAFKPVFDDLMAKRD